MLARFKEWLKDSGTTTSRGAKVLDSLNPFEMIVENPAYPFARIERESFWVGLSDTYGILLGRHYGDGKTYKGFLDLLLFPVLSRRLLDYINKYHLRHRGFFNNTFVTLVFLVSLALEIVRSILGWALTLALSPLVAIVHIFTSLIAQTEQKKNAVAGILAKASNENQSLLQKLAYFINENINENQPLLQKLAYFIIDGVRKRFIIAVAQDPNLDPALETRPLVVSKLCAPNALGPSSTAVAIIKMTPENEEGLLAVLQLNMFDAAAQLQKQGMLEGIEERIKSPRKIREMATEILEDTLQPKAIAHLALSYAEYATPSQDAEVEQVFFKPEPR